jgi:hypothetical protein
VFATTVAYRRNKHREAVSWGHVTQSTMRQCCPVCGELNFKRSLLELGHMQLEENEGSQVRQLAMDADVQSLQKSHTKQNRHNVQFTPI